MQKPTNAFLITSALASLAASSHTHGITVTCCHRKALREPQIPVLKQQDEGPQLGLAPQLSLSHPCTFRGRLANPRALKFIIKVGFSEPKDAKDPGLLQVRSGRVRVYLRGLVTAPKANQHKSRAQRQNTVHQRVKIISKGETGEVGLHFLHFYGGLVKSFQNGNFVIILLKSHRTRVPNPLCLSCIPLISLFIYSSNTHV